METTEVNPQIPFSIGRMMMMGTLSIILCVSMIMTVFTPFPIGLAAVIFGRAKGIILAVLASAAFFVFSTKLGGDYSLFGFYIVCAVLGIGLAEIVTREISPVRGILAIGLLITVMMTGLLYSYQQEKKDSMKTIVVEILKTTFKPYIAAQVEQLKEREDKRAFEDMALLSQPEKMADRIIKEAPGVFFVSLFFMLWANTYMLLKSNRVFNQKVDAKYTELDLLNFKVPELFIIPVIGSLMLSVWGNYIASWLPDLGLTFITCFAVFYFFQGFGIYIAFLEHMKIKGFVRTALVVIGVLTAGQVLAVLGLFDMFVNFRKFLNKQASS
jgi:hypothetical protein